MLRSWPCSNYIIPTYLRLVVSPETQEGPLATGFHHKRKGNVNQYAQTWGETRETIHIHH
jgi:hypothetical protein